MNVQIKRREKIGKWVMVGRRRGSNVTQDLAAADTPDILRGIAAEAGWNVVSRWS